LVGQTFTGHNHDYKILKEEFSTEEAWFEDLSTEAQILWYIDWPLPKL